MSISRSRAPPRPGTPGWRRHNHDIGIKRVQADLRLRCLLADHGVDPVRPVRGHVRQQPGALIAEAPGERPDGGLAASLADPRHPPGVVIGDDDQVLALPLAPGLLADADPAQPVQPVQPGRGVRRDPGGDARQRLPGDPQLRRSPRPRHMRRLPRRELLERPAEPVIVPRPRHRGGDLPVLAAHDPRQPRFQERPLAVHVQGPPPHHVRLHGPAALPALRAPAPRLLVRLDHDDQHFLRRPVPAGPVLDIRLTTTACSVSSTSSHTDPANASSPAHRAPLPSGTARYPATGRPL